jgi:VanZ family protein
MLSLRYAGRWRSAGVLLLVLVLAAAMMPPSWYGPVDLQPIFANFDKWLHGATFTMLSLWFAGQYARHSYWRIAMALAGFGLLIEVAQRAVTYRTADGMDLLADLAGVSIGMLIALIGAGGWCLRVEEWLQDRRG